MALFCPTCHNLLLVRENPSLRFYCRTCPYIMPVTEKVIRKTMLTTKKVGDALGKEHEYKGAKTPAVCPHCGHNEAWFHQIQIRSADEPMTTFFTCCGCELRWREQ